MPMWWGAQALVIIGSSFNMFALGLADQALLSIGSAFTLIFNALMASRFLGERLPGYRIVTIILISLGAWIVAYFGSYESKQYTSQEMLDLMFSPGSDLFLICLIGGITLAFISSVTTIKLVER
jgi:drug/metabolite transporter (DMT)-like permease